MWRVVLILTAMLVGCANDKIIRAQSEPCELTPTDAGQGLVQCPESHQLYERATQSTGDGDISPVNSSLVSLYELGVVEFDDQGLIRARAQLNATLNMLKKHDGNVDVVLFIHGWHHNAMADDSNFKSFQLLLRRLALRSPSRHIVGVYVGWRGENYPSPFTEIPLLRDSNFWDRKNVSIEVGRGALYELIERIRLKTEALPKSRLIMIGHSFGASVLLSVGKNEVYRDLIQDRYEVDFLVGPPLKPLMILVNPAIEATHFLPLFELPEETALMDSQLVKESNDVRPSSRYKKPVTPRIAVFMSESDEATKKFFRLGRMVSTFMESHRVLVRLNRRGEKVTYSEFEMDTQALGHYKPFLTHALTSRKPDRGMMSGRCPAKVMTWDERLKGSVIGEGWQGFFQASDTHLTHLNNSPAFSPVWVVKVDKKIIPDHNQIWDRGLDCFIEELVLTGAPESYKNLASE